MVHHSFASCVMVRQTIVQAGGQAHRLILDTRVGNSMVHRALACAGACATHGADLFCMVWVVQLTLVQDS